MKLLRLNQRGVAHHFVLALSIVGIISAFAFQAVAGHAETGAAAIANPANCKAARPIVKPGQANGCVAKMQKAIGGLKVDGQFGNGTKARVVAVQRANSLKPDGLVDTCTWKAILRESIPASCKSTATGSTTTVSTVSSSDTSKPSPLVYCSYTTNSGTSIVNNERITLTTCKGHSGMSTESPQQPAFRTASIDLDFSRLTGKKLGIASICATVKRLTLTPRSTGVTFGTARVSRALARDVSFASKLVEFNSQGCRKLDTKTDGTNKATSFKSTVTANPYTGLTDVYLKDANGKTYKFKLGN